MISAHPLPLAAATLAAVLMQANAPVARANAAPLAPGPENLALASRPQNLGSISLFVDIGQASGSSNTANAMAQASDGTLWLAEGPTLVAEDPVAATELQVPGPVDGADFPTIIRGPGGALWFTEGTNIYRMDSGPRLTRAYSVGGTPRYLATGPGDMLWFTLERSSLPFSAIGSIDPAGHVKTLPVQTGDWDLGPITVGPDGALWFVCSSILICRTTTAGKTAAYRVPNPPGEAQPYPSSIASDPSGPYLWITAETLTGQGYLDRLALTGKFIEYSLGVGSSPNSIVAGPDGAVWYADGGLNLIGRMKSGRLTRYRVPQSATFPQYAAADTCCLVVGKSDIWFDSTLFIGSISAP